MSTVLEMKDIVKRFPGVLANHNVNLKVEKGSIHALMGENGAGKSTLMNILYGLYNQTSGDVYYEGELIKIKNPKDAIEKGIGMVHQHFMLVEALTVVENVMLGGKNGVFLPTEKCAQEFRDLGLKYNMDIDPYAIVEELSVGQQQRVEILKAIYKGAKLLILDEPTAVLTPHEVEELFNMMNKLKSEGTSIIFISHKLHEVLYICDDITVLRKGEGIGTVKASETTKEELSLMMVGRPVSLQIEKGPYNPGEVIVELDNVTSKLTHGRQIKDISFNIRKGEILGIAGVDGNGQDELLDVITGLGRVVEGEIRIKGEVVNNINPREILEKSVSHVPADRHKRGMVTQMSIKENMALVSYYEPPYAKGPFMDWKYITKKSKELIQTYNVKTPDENEVGGKLSGGNQQKMVLGREMDRDPDFLIAAHPVRGLDIGAMEFIYSLLVEQRDKGKAVLLVSTELDEVISLSDRIAVFFDGELMGILEKDEFNTQEIGLMMAGTKKD